MTNCYCNSRRHAITDHPVPGCIVDDCSCRAVRGGYPPDWPRCAACGDYALDGHVTCGRQECDEAKWRA